MPRRRNYDHAASLDLLLVVKEKSQSSVEAAEDDPNQGGEHQEHHLEKDQMHLHSQSVFTC